MCARPSYALTRMQGTFSIGSQSTLNCLMLRPTWFVVALAGSISQLQQLGSTKHLHHMMANTYNQYIQCLNLRPTPCIMGVWHGQVSFSRLGDIHGSVVNIEDAYCTCFVRQSYRRKISRLSSCSTSKSASGISSGYASDATQILIFACQQFQYSNKAWNKIFDSVNKCTSKQHDEKRYQIGQEKQILV